MLEELEDEWVDLITADNGETALDKFRSETTELVFLDVMMPKMNGFDVCNTVKNELAIKNVYVVLLTAKGQGFDKLNGAEVGADVYMSKPFNPDEVLEKARKVLWL